ncbi:uncharacterized protein LOC125494982 [Beta vulgaris subsp. vulgaris]|uniref:uncharacterized protein LOC125494982 n=1 Tax=Beta vulgaris subsp. vulgaris TaxID=3555 RepID=UPI002036DA5E|nr:uncharacterized protein LOC125494982 [Beta vulgaris subsp. vulgaris]
MAKGRKRDMVPQENATSETEYDDDGNRAEHEDRRGRTVCATVGKAIQEGRKIPLEWNRRKVPCGDHRMTFCTYLGVLVRERVDINYLRWGDVPKELKNSLYESITKGFTILEGRKRYILSQAAIAFRIFKARLRKSGCTLPGDNW